LDIPDILIVIQWRVTCNMETLWQRFGRAARDPNLEAVAILFAETKHFDRVKDQGQISSDVAGSKRKRSTTNANDDLPSRTGKRCNIEASMVSNWNSSVVAAHIGPTVGGESAVHVDEA